MDILGIPFPFKFEEKYLNSMVAKVEQNLSKKISDLAKRVNDLEKSAKSKPPVETKPHVETKPTVNMKTLEYKT